MTSSAHTAVGSGALQLVDNSSINNTAVGYNAGNAITSGDNNICIGYEADAAATLNGQIVIGTSVSGTAANTLTIKAGSSDTFTTAFVSTTGSSAGTLTNAPSVGNPVGYLNITLAGTTRYIPFW
jgi:hypothetical protein